MKRCSRTMALLSTILTTVGLMAAPSVAVADTWTDPAVSVPRPVLVPVTATSCPAAPTPGHVTCLAEAEPAPEPSDATTVRPLYARSKSGSYNPSDLASLYRIPADLRPTDTIGIIDVGSDPNTQAQMSYFRRYFELPSCTTQNGCFREVGQDGTSRLPGPNSEWITEIAIDVQAVSAICPTCHILLVDANTASITDMAKATLTATRLGATYVSLSFGSPESPYSASMRNAYYSDPNVTYVAAAGDSGYSGGALFPASASNVVAAGGTSVRLVNGVWQQAAWAGSGSGCSSLQTISVPQAEESLGDVCRGKRVVSDLSALADPDTGMLFWRAGSWWNAGGTSLAAPILAGLYALAGNHTSPMSVYNATAQLVDITRGSTGTCSPRSLCTAGEGWDGPTGLGTPSGLAALVADGTTAATYRTPTSGTLSADDGYPVTVTYRLRDAVTGAGVPAALATLQERRTDGSFATLRSARTDSSGVAVFTDTPRGASTYRVLFAGSAVHEPSTSDVLTVTRFAPEVSVRTIGGALSASLRAPWGGAASSVPVKLQERRGRGWVTTRSARTNAKGVATLPVERGETYRVRWGGGRWQRGYTRPVRVR